MCSIFFGKAGDLSFLNRFHEQVALLNAGEPLQAFDAFYASAVVMYDNDVMFAADKAEGRAKQLPFFQSAKSIVGWIEDAATNQEDARAASGVGVFRNRSRFVTKDGKQMQIDGLVWQKWANHEIVEERYYRDDLMAQKIKNGILAP